VWAGWAILVDTLNQCVVRDFGHRCLLIRSDRLARGVCLFSCQRRRLLVVSDMGPDLVWHCCGAKLHTLLRKSPSCRLLSPQNLCPPSVSLNNFLPSPARLPSPCSQLGFQTVDATVTLLLCCFKWLTVSLLDGTSTHRCSWSRFAACFASRVAERLHLLSCWPRWHLSTDRLDWNAAITSRQTAADWKSQSYPRFRRHGAPRFVRLCGAFRVSTAPALALHGLSWSGNQPFPFVSNV